MLYLRTLPEAVSPAPTCVVDICQRVAYEPILSQDGQPIIKVPLDVIVPPDNPLPVAIEVTVPTPAVLALANAEFAYVLAFVILVF